MPPRNRRTTLCAFLLTGALSITVTGARTVITAAPALAAVTTADAWTDKPRYAPGEPATVTAKVSGTGPVNFRLTHLGTLVSSGTVQATGAGAVS